MMQGRDGSFLSIDQLDKDLVVRLSELQVGGYSQPLDYTDERGKKGLRLIYLRTKSEPHRENLKDDYNRISSRAIEEKKELALEKWFEQKTRGYYIFLDDEFKSCASLKHWVEIANKSQKINVRD